MLERYDVFSYWLVLALTNDMIVPAVALLASLTRPHKVRMWAKLPSAISTLAAMRVDLPMQPLRTLSDVTQ